MPKRKKKHEPEMLIVSFCDIVTITTAALFFALLITVQEAVKVPVFKPTPRAKSTTKQPIFFECRNGSVCFIDKVGLDEQVTKMLSALSPSVKGGDLKQFLNAVSGNEIGNEYYKVVPSYLLTAIVALEPKPGARGDNTNQVHEVERPFQKTLAKYDKEKVYTVFLVRDDSFDVFHQARMAADHRSFDVGWELLGSDEPIKFGTGGSSIDTQ